MPSKFCFVCGKSGRLFDGMCADCYNERHALISIADRFELTACSRCGLLRIGSKWQAFDAEAFLKSKMKIAGDIESVDVRHTDETYEMTVSGRLPSIPKPKTERHAVTIHLNKILCPVCSRAAGGYYEAVLQLRGAIPVDAMAFFEREAAKLLARDSRAFWWTKEVKEGIDIKIGSASAANKLAELLKQRYRPEIKKSYQLVGRKAGTNIYRTTISVRFRQPFK